MKVKYPDQQVTFNMTITGGAGSIIDSLLVTGVPELEAGDAFLLKRARIVDSQDVYSSAVHNVSFKWAIGGGAFAAQPDFVGDKTVVLVTRAGGQTAGGESYLVGGAYDQVEVKNLGYGVLEQMPIKDIYAGVLGTNLVAGSFQIRLDFDIVTLTTAEMADLYNRGIV